MIRTSSEMKPEVRPNMRGGPGSVTVTPLFDKSAFGAKVRFCAKMVLPSGAGIGMHQHEGEDEVYVITRGSGILDDGKDARRVSAGDAILTGRGESHAITNDGSSDLEIIAMIMCYA